MRVTSGVAVVSATAAAALSAAATGGPVVVEAHPLARVAVGAVGWAVYGPLSVLLLALGLRLLARLPHGAWGVGVVAAAKVLDLARDLVLVGRVSPGGHLDLATGPVALITVAGLLALSHLASGGGYDGSRSVEQPTPE